MLGVVDYSTYLSTLPWCGPLLSTTHVDWSWLTTYLIQSRILWITLLVTFMNLKPTNSRLPITTCRVWASTQTVSCRDSWCRESTLLTPSPSSTRTPTPFFFLTILFYILNAHNCSNELPHHSGWTPTSLSRHPLWHPFLLLIDASQNSELTWPKTTLDPLIAYQSFNGQQRLTATKTLNEKAFPLTA